MLSEHPVKERTLHLCGYVDLGLDDLVTVFSRPGTPQLMESSLRTAMGSAGEGMSLQVSEPERLSDTTARLSIDWRRTARDGAVYEGTAMVSLLVVQSGAQSITELLVALPVDEDVAAWVAAATRRFLDDVTARLAAVAA